MTTPEEGLAAIHARFGAHAGHRALHAKGVICASTFTATPEAAALTRAGHMSGEPIPATARLSNGGGDPTDPDYSPDVRGLAVAFHLADGTRTDILAQTLPRFPFPDERGFFDSLAISKPSLSALLKLPGFAVRNPRALAELPKVNRILNRCASFAARRYYPFHAYRWIAADGSERYVRYTWLPTVDEPDIRQVRGQAPGPRLPVRRARAAARARAGADASSRSRSPPPATTSTTPPRSGRTTASGSPSARSRSPAIDRDADDSIVMDPMRLVDGIEPSGDPVLRYRPAVYDLSHRRRTSK